MKKERMYGLDILRILSMLGIIGLHIMNKGKWGACADSAPEVLILRILSTVCYCSVNVFAMLSGFLYAERRTVRSSNLIRLLFSVAFYSVVILAVFLLGLPQTFARAGHLHLQAIFPPLSSTYWYITCYVPLFLMIPYINALIHTLTEIRFRRMLLILFLLLSVMTTFGMKDYFKLDHGYSLLWLVFCYLLGAYLRLHRMDQPNAEVGKWLGLLLLDILLTVGSWYLLGNDIVWGKLRIVDYVSPFMVIEAALLLLIFSRLTIRRVPLRKIILSLSDASFGVYLIHAHILVFDLLLLNTFLWTKGYGASVYFAAMIGGMLGIYLICWAIDVVRGILFKWLRIDELAELIGGKVDTFLHWSS